jgi:hypothetical protein
VRPHSTTLGNVWLETLRRRGGATATATALALLGLFVSAVLLHNWTVGTVVVQITVAVLFAVGIFITSLAGAVRLLETKLATASRDIEVVQYRIGVHKGIASVLEAFPRSGGDEDAQLRWLAHRAVEVLRTDRFLSVEKVRQVEEIASDESMSLAERLVKLKQHLRARLIEGRYLLP